MELEVVCQKAGLATRQSDLFWIRWRQVEAWKKSLGGKCLRISPLERYCVLKMENFSCTQLCSSFVPNHHDWHGLYITFNPTHPLADDQRKLKSQVLQMSLFRYSWEGGQQTAVQCPFLFLSLMNSDPAVSITTDLNEPVVWFCMRQLHMFIYSLSTKFFSLLSFRLINAQTTFLGTWKFP